MERWKMRKRKKLGLFCFWRSLALGLTLGLTLGVCMGLVVGGGQAWANPIPCEYLTLSRQAGLVEVRFEANKACYETAPDLTQSTTYRDFFPVELSFTLQETAEYFTFSATDFEASAERHLYTISLSSYDISKRVEPSGEGEGASAWRGAETAKGPYWCCPWTPSVSPTPWPSWSIGFGRSRRAYWT